MITETVKELVWTTFFSKQIEILSNLSKTGDIYKATSLLSVKSSADISFGLLLNQIDHVKNNYKLTDQFIILSKKTLHMISLSILVLRSFFVL